MNGSAKLNDSNIWDTASLSYVTSRHKFCVNLCHSPALPANETPPRIIGILAILEPECLLPPLYFIDIAQQSLLSQICCNRTGSSSH